MSQQPANKQEILDALNEFNQSIEKYLEEGYSQEQAELRAAFDNGIRLTPDYQALEVIMSSGQGFTRQADMSEEDGMPNPLLDPYQDFGMENPGLMPTQSTLEPTSSTTATSTQTMPNYIEQEDSMLLSD